MLQTIRAFWDNVCRRFNREPRIWLVIFDVSMGSSMIVVSCKKPSRSIEVEYIAGPFRSLIDAEEAQTSLQDTCFFPRRKKEQTVHAPRKAQCKHP